MDPKKIVPAVTAGVLGAVWLVMTIQHQEPPAVLTQAIVAAVGSLVAGQAVNSAKASRGAVPSD